MNVNSASCWADFCNEDDIECWRSCYNRHGSTPGYWVCGAACQAAYMACLGQCPVVAVIDTIDSIAKAATDFVRDHPGLVAGTIVVVAGVTMLAVMGPTGVIVLVAI